MCVQSSDSDDLLEPLGIVTLEDVVEELLQQVGPCEHLCSPAGRGQPYMQLGLTCSGWACTTPGCLAPADQHQLHV